MSNLASQNPKPLSNLGSLRASGAHWPEREVSRHRATGSVLTAAARLSLILPSLRVGDHTDRAEALLAPASASPPPLRLHFPLEPRSPAPGSP